VADITYLHVELDHHDIILAEGLPAESYLDSGNRGDFANAPGVARLHVDPMARDEQALVVWATKACAELVEDGERLASVRRRLAERAMVLGLATTDDPDLGIVADGVALRPEFADGAYHFFCLGGTQSASDLTQRGSRRGRCCERRPSPVGGGRDRHGCRWRDDAPRDRVAAGIRPRHSGNGPMGALP